jgi:hypothetical protein
LNPAGRILSKPTARTKREQVLAMTEAAGSYRLEARAPEKKAAPDINHSLRALYKNKERKNYNL